MSYWAENQPQALGVNQVVRGAVTAPSCGMFTRKAFVKNCSEELL